MNVPWFPLIGMSAVCWLFSSCGDNLVQDQSKPKQATKKGFEERVLSGTGGYKQDESGAWVPSSDKRSSFDSQRESKYFKGEVETREYKTGDYAKKSWWGNKQYEKNIYQGNTDASRFQKQAIQNGILSSDSGRKASKRSPFQTNTIGSTSAEESTRRTISSPVNEEITDRRDRYIAPSVIDWREQRSLSIEQTRSVLGR